MDIGTFLKQVRMEKNISIRQLAQFTGISPAYISQIENGKRKNPKRYVLRVLFDGLGMDYDEFMARFHAQRKDASNDIVLPYGELKQLSSAEQTLEKPITTTAQRTDLQQLLQSENKLYYNGKLLSAKEKEKLLTMLQLLFE